MELHEKILKRKGVLSMDKFDISRKILDLLDCDGDEIVDAIYNLAKEVEKEYEQEEEENEE